MHFDASFFVAVGFVLFILLLGYLGVHTILANALDGRGKLISAELDEAKRLREEAESVLASYKQRAAEAETEAGQIIAQAKEEAEAMAAETAKRMEEFVARRTRQAEEQIALAETQAANEVRAAAADAAARAAESVMRSTVTGSKADDLIMQGIEGLKGKLH